MDLSGFAKSTFSGAWKSWASSKAMLSTGMLKLDVSVLNKDNCPQWKASGSSSSSSSEKSFFDKITIEMTSGCVCLF